MMKSVYHDDICLQNIYGSYGKKHVLVEKEVRSPMRDKRTGKDRAIQPIEYAGRLRCATVSL